jgi:hypothetical protein
MEELKPLPCPFDGETDDNLKMASLSRTFHRVECLICGAVGPYASTREGAVAYWNTRPESVNAHADLVEALKRVLPLLRLLTVRQVIEAGDEAITAAGLNPWCINEGLAEGSERLGLWWVEAAVAKAT